MRQPIVKSKRQLIRLWFEFLKMAQREEALADNVRASAAFYADWGEIEGVKFDDWFKDHSHLFGDTDVQVISRATQSPSSLLLSVPLNQPISKTLSQVKALVEGKQRERLLELGIDPSTAKSLNIGFGRYDFTPGVELRGRTLYEVQLIYGLYQALGKPAVNSAFAEQVVKHLKERPRSKWSPYILSLEPQKDRRGNLRYDEGQLRQLRRYLKRGYSVCEAVSKGEFPGKGTM